MKLWLLLFCFSVSATKAADLVYTDGNHLQGWFSAPDNNFLAIGSKSAYIRGIADVLDGSYFCIPSNVTIGQLTSVVGKYLDNNPEDWHSPAQFLVVDALRTAFPCKKE